MCGETYCEGQFRCQNLSPPSVIDQSCRVVLTSSGQTTLDLSKYVLLHYLYFSVTLSLQWQKLADSPPRIQCSSCVTCRRSSDPTSSSSPTSSAMQPGCSRLEILPPHTCLTYQQTVVRIVFT